MKNLLTCLALLASCCAFAQQKGAAPISGGLTSKSSGQTYAVVIGISDYQDPGIPDLRFADKDAEAFANFLRSPAGGSLDDDHLKLLTNKEATMGQFAAALDWLMELTMEGDNAIVYFSGHGDVEKKTLTQPGYLLCWDAPSRVYMGGGAFALNMLQEVISTLSIQNKAKVVVITDACRSGNLAGQSVGGAQATAANLAKQYANEIKILSCQPNEYSIEGEQWGGGRGAFSFNLVDALYGMADGNNDLFVTLQEVGRYLEDHVTAEVAPVSQVPMVIGNRTERVATVDSKLLADLRSGRTSQMKMLSPIEMRGMEEDVLATVDTTLRELYRMFKQTLKDKVFLEPAQACADAYYERLMAEPKMQRLHSTMTRNYAAALQDDAQQVLKTLISTGLTKEVLAKVRASKIYESYPKYLKRAAELLGENHYMYRSLMARSCYFEGKIRKKPEERNRFYKMALEYQPDIPHATAEMITVFSSTQEDSVIYYASKAASLVPNWVVPYALLLDYYQFVLRDYDKADSVLSYALQLDSNSVYLWYLSGSFFNSIGRFEEAEKMFLRAVRSSNSEICFPCLYNELGILYISTGRFQEAIDVCKKAINMDTQFVVSYNNLAVAYLEMQRFEDARQCLEKAKEIDPDMLDTYLVLGQLNHFSKQYEEAVQNYTKAIELGQGFARAQTHAYTEMGLAYIEMGKFEDAGKASKMAIEIDSTSFKAYNNLGVVYLSGNRLMEAEQAFLTALKYNLRYMDPYYNLAVVCAKLKRVEKAFSYLEALMQLGFQDYNWIMEDPELEVLRSQKDHWIPFKKKYLPEKF